MRRLALIIMIGCAGCGQPPEMNRVEDEIAGEITAPEIVSVRALEQPPPEISEDISFEEMLRQYQELNRRLEAVSYRLQKANVKICPDTTKTLGYTVHTIRDYPEMLQFVARDLLNVSDDVSIRTVSEGSPAFNADLQPADQIVQVNGSYVPGGRTAATFYGAISKYFKKQDRVELKLRRGEEMITATLKPETICDYPVAPYFSEKINAYTDGEEIWVTSELIRSTSREIDLALVLAHEMAHAIAGHADKSPSKKLELEADRMGLIMLARAGYDVNDVADNWLDAPYPHRQENANIDVTHPSPAERLAYAQKTIAAIGKAQNSGRMLNFKIK